MIQPINYVMEARRRRKMGFLRESGELYMLACQRYEMEGDLFSAAKIAFEGGLEGLTRAVAVKAVEKCMGADNYLGAAIIAETVGWNEKAQEMYGLAVEECVKRKEYVSGAVIAEIAGFGDKAKELYELVYGKLP